MDGSAGPGAHPAAAPESGSTYAHVAGLPLVIDRCELQPLVRDTTSGFTKVSIVVRLGGGPHVGEGEDITWDQIDQIEFLRSGDDLTWMHGTRTFDEFSRLLGLANVFPVGPIRDSARFYRRWALERGAGSRPAPERPLAPGRRRPSGPAGHFVASVRIGDPPSLLPVHLRLAVDPGLRFWKALSLAHIAANESCARRIDWLGAPSASDRIQLRIVGERRRDMARLSQNAHARARGPLAPAYRLVAAGSE